MTKTTTHYRKRSDLLAVYVPGFGRVEDDRLLSGDLARYVPALLVPVSAPVAPVATVPAPAPVPVETAGLVPVSDDPGQVEEGLEDDQSPRSGRKARK